MIQELSLQNKFKERINKVITNAKENIVFRRFKNFVLVAVLMYELSF